MTWWDSYRAVYGAELRAAAREYAGHGWPVVLTPEGLQLRTGGILDILEVSAGVGRAVCALLRAAGEVVPVAATPTGRWWFPVAGGASVDPALQDEVVLHTAGTGVLAPPTEVPDGWVHWRVPPGNSAYRLPPAEVLLNVIADAVRRSDRDEPGTQRPGAPTAVATRP